MDFEIFKQKLIDRRNLFLALEKPLSHKEKEMINYKIKLIELEISGRGLISTEQFSTRLEAFFKISRKELLEILKPLYSQAEIKVEYIKDIKTGKIQGLKFDGFKTYLQMIDDNNFSLKYLYERSVVRPTCLEESFKKFPNLEEILWGYMKVKSELTNANYSKILTEELEKNKRLLVRLQQERSEAKLKKDEKDSEIAKITESNNRINKDLNACMQGKVSIFN